METGFPPISLAKVAEMDSSTSGNEHDDQEAYEAEYLSTEFQNQDGMNSLSESLIPPVGELSEINSLAGAPEGAEDTCLFFFQGVFYRRLFKGQLKPKEVATKNVGGDTVQEVFNCIWSEAKKHIMRQIVFDDDGPKWAEKQLPDEGDMEQFITINDPSKKRTYTVSAVTPRVITTWRGKQIKIFLHAYSTSVESNVQHQLVLRKLVAPSDADRSGAHSTRDDSALAKELKETHPDLDGHHSSWLLWANLIHSSEAHKMEQMKNEPAPPLELAKYFRWTNVSESARLQSVHRGVTVAQTVNGGWLRDVKEIFDGLSSAMSILKNVAQKVEAMVTKGAAGEELIAAMEAAVRPEETELSHVLANNITDCPDVDHA